ncbi:MAG TPA: hypothetical protein ENK49_12820 [Gammaproteobacteria bacterium]|nr:hypothetical protein [Gammaproteobacteria bacterium]
MTATTLLRRSQRGKQVFRPASAWPRASRILTLYCSRPSDCYPNRKRICYCGYRHSIPGEHHRNPVRM